LQCRHFFSSPSSAFCPIIITSIKQNKQSTTSLHCQPLPQNQQIRPYIVYARADTIKNPFNGEDVAVVVATGVYVDKNNEKQVVDIIIAPPTPLIIYDVLPSGTENLYPLQVFNTQEGLLLHLQEAIMSKPDQQANLHIIVGYGKTEKQQNFSWDEFSNVWSATLSRPSNELVRFYENEGVNVYSKIDKSKLSSLK